MYINFQQNRANRSAITGHTNVFAIRILKNHAFRTCTTPLRTFRPILRSIGLLDIEIPRKEIISTDDGQTSRTTTIQNKFSWCYLFRNHAIGELQVGQYIDIYPIIMFFYYYKDLLLISFRVFSV